MAVVRTVLPRKGIIEPQHGANYESDLDTNWQTLDSLLQDATDVQAAVTAAGTVEALLSDLDINGVVSGFALSTSSTLTPGLASGVLYAQGKRYAPSAPAPGAAAANATNYLFYNGTTGFYYNQTGNASAEGDAFIGTVTTGSTAVTAVVPASKIFGQVTLQPGAAGNFTVAHGLGRVPVAAQIRMTSSGAIWWQSPTDMDSTYLYLVASDAGVTGKIMVW